VPNSAVPSFPGSVPDAVVSRLADLRPLIGSWLEADSGEPGGPPPA
jgi:hypothetical protein